MNRRKSSSPRAVGQTDYWLLLSVLLLSGMGLIMVLSSSGIMAEQSYGDQYFFFKKQVVFFVLGLGGMYLFSRIPRILFYELTYVWMAFAVILLALTAFTPLGIKSGGATRWLSVGFASVQPLEFAKLALVLYLAYFFSRKQEMVRTFSVGFLPPFIATFSLAIMLLAQPDFGGAVFLVGILFFMCLVGGTRIVYLFLAFGSAGWAGWLLITQSAYRMKRWTAFLDPFKVARDEGYQLVQSFYAFGSGRITGVGLGDGTQKLFYLPEAHNDFIMAVVGEELGFIGMAVIFGLIGLIVYRCMRIAYIQEDLQDRFTAFGLTLLLALGFFLNLAVVLGTVPPKGVPMPFVSYGGSSLLVSFLAVGLLLNIGRGKSS